MTTWSVVLQQHVGLRINCAAHCWQQLRRLLSRMVSRSNGIGGSQTASTSVLPGTWRSMLDISPVPARLHRLWIGMVSVHGCGQDAPSTRRRLQPKRLARQGLELLGKLLRIADVEREIGYRLRLHCHQGQFTHTRRAAVRIFFVAEVAVGVVCHVSPRERPDSSSHRRGSGGEYGRRPPAALQRYA